MSDSTLNRLLMDHPRWRSALAALLTGALAALAFPPSLLWPLGFVALLPLLGELDRGRGFGVAFLAGLVYHTLTVSWIGANIDPPPLLARLSAGGAIFWLSLLWGLTGALTHRLRRRLGPWGLCFLPVFMVAIDWLVEGTEMGFPWALLGATQVDDPLLRPLAALGGMHAITLALLAANLLLYRLFRPLGPRRPFWIGLALWLALVPLLGRWARGDVSDTGRQVDLLLVQGNIDPVAKWDRPWMDTVARHLELTRAAMAEGARPQLVIWPETAVPTKLRLRPHLVDLLAEFCRESGAALLTGANDAEDGDDGQRRPYNGSFLVTERGLAGMYHKIRLVPFGERVPGQRFIPGLGGINLGQAEFAPGTSMRAGRLALPEGDSLRFAWSICFEGNFAALARAMVRDGAQLLVNQTNDAWFGTGRELDQHLAIARLRAVETGRWLVRACNNGNTAVVAPDGTVARRLPKGREGTLAARVPLRQGSTFYLRAGDLLPRLCVLLATWGLVLAIVVGGSPHPRLRRTFPRCQRGKGITALRCWGLLALLLATTARANDAWLPGLTGGTRARSMGGCFAALSTAVDAQLYNPAGLAGLEHRGRLVLTLDPVGPLLAKAAHSPGDWAWAESLPRAALLRRLEWRGPHLSLALTPAEWLPARSSSLAALGKEERPASGELTPSLSAGLALDARVRLGVSVGAWYDAQHGRRRAGVAYGAIIRANQRMDVGGQAVYLPVGALDARRALDQLGDGTVNVGVAWHPFGRAAESPRRATLLLALDVRNVTQEAGLAGKQELHLGAEAHLPVGLDLRAGIAWPNLGGFSEGQPCPGGGLGWRGRLLGGSLGLDLGWTRDPAVEGRGIWMGGLQWSL